MMAHTGRLRPEEVSFSGFRYMKGVGMLVVSLRGINFGFWSHLGCSGQNAIRPFPIALSTF